MAQLARRILVLAGHDPTGGAGVDADREAARARGVIADCVVTAETDQDGVRVSAIRPREPATWLEEARAWLREHGSRVPVVVKTGLLPGADHIRALVEFAEAAPDLTLIVDPVLAASGGETFLDEEGLSVLRRQLLPLGPILTPNLPEAARLVSRSPSEFDELEQRVAAGEQFLAWGARAALIKGGHGEDDPVRDLIVQRERSPIWHEHPRIPGASLHGSGCRYASCVAAELAKGNALEAAADVAGQHLAALLAQKQVDLNS